MIQLIKKADVLVENFRPGTMKKLGLEKKNYLKLILNLFMPHVLGLDKQENYLQNLLTILIVQALGGIMSLTGYENQDPVRVGTSIGDITAGLFTTIGIQAALIRRNLTKQGSYIDISMLDCQTAILENAVSRYYSEKKVPKKIGSRHPSIAPLNVLNAKMIT